MAKFHLHERLSRDTYALGDWKLCRVLLMNDARFPWLILVPRRAKATEIFDLSDADQRQLLRETSHAAAVLKSLTSARKINIGALGNLVPQLHVHVVARKTQDAAWPGPVWGSGAAKPYPAKSRAEQVRKFAAALAFEG